MGKYVLLVSYLAAWALFAGWVILTAVRDGWPIWAVVGGILLLFVLANNALAYTSVSRSLRAEGKQPPSRFAFLTRGLRAARLNEVAPPSLHVLVSALAAGFGGFLVFCGVALALDADWSGAPHPVMIAVICAVPVATGAGCLWTAWRVFTRRGGAGHVV